MFSYALPCDSNLESMLTAGIYSSTLKPVVTMATQYLSRSTIKSDDSDQSRDLAKKNHIKGLFWLQAAVEEMDTHAMFLLAHELFNPEGQAYDPASAVALLQSGAALGDQNCTALLAYQFNHHPGMIRNQYYGAQINLHAANHGDYVAMQNLGTQLKNGEGVPIDHKAADFWFRRSFEKQMENGGADVLPSEVERHQVGRGEAKVLHLNFTLFKRGSRF
jgi:TPR repeat protein